MALVTLQRSPSVAGSPQCSNSDAEAEDDEGNKIEKSECFFAGKGTALVLALKDIPQYAERRLSTDSIRSTNSTQSNNSDIQQHLQSMFYLLTHEETLKMAVKLESQRPNRTRYLVIASRCCYRASTTERKSKITRNNSAKMSSTSTTPAPPPPTGISNTARQLSVDSNSNRSHHQLQQLQQQQSQIVEASGGGGVDNSNRQSIKCDATADKNSASGDSQCSDGIEESCLLGIDCNERATIGLVVPILADTTIHLDGDGGFSVAVYGKTHIFKPVSVQAMWSALQTLHKVSQKARENNFYPGGPSHDWLSYYESRIESDQSCLNEWNAMDSLESRRPPSPDAIRNKPTAKEETESVIKMKLKEIMMSVDLDEVTSKYIRGRLEEHLDMDLGEYKSFIDEEMLMILGQMDAPTEIFEHVYLGSEWNASNLEELQKNGVRHILNVTREIDNFFPGMFDYFNVRVYDDEKTNLLKHWDNTYRYITRAKAENSKVLVHCKMGVSRSASVVIAYAMKAYNWEFAQALQHVKQRRNCIKPNKNFLNQLETYRGMLDAMKNKEKLQRSKSETNLKSTGKDARLLPGSEPTPLIQALNQSKSKSAGHGVSGSGIDAENATLLGGVSGGIGGAETSTHAGGVGGIVGVSSISSASDHKQRRVMRRSSSTSPKSIRESHTAIVMKQQSQSLENLTPERSVADEPKNVRFPGSNGENYSVTQNQVLHIQKNTPPPPPPPLPPMPPSVSSSSSSTSSSTKGNATTTASSAAATSSSVTSVRTIVHGLETYQDAGVGCGSGGARKTVDDRKTLNLQFGRSISQDTTGGSTALTDQQQQHIDDDAGACVGGVNNPKSLGSPVWTSSAKLITQTSNLTEASAPSTTSSSAPLRSSLRLRRDTTGSSISSCSGGDAPTATSTTGYSGGGDMFSAQLDNVFTKSETAAVEDKQRHSRKTQSWAATSGGIVIEPIAALSSKLGSNSSIDSTASSSAGGGCGAVYEGFVRTRPRQRELPSRHASWGSGDNRYGVPMRNSSWNAFDTNRNAFQFSGGGGSVGAGTAGAIVEGQIHELNMSNKTATTTPTTNAENAQQQQHVGTVKRTKQKLEECTALKKLCQENGGELPLPSESSEATASAPTTISPAAQKRSSNLYRSASAAGSTRSRYPQRCNSEEFAPAASGGLGLLSRTTAARRSDGSRPLHAAADLLTSSAIAATAAALDAADIENKNTLLAASLTDSEEAVVLRAALANSTTAAEDQRISGNVQILKKSFEAKAGGTAGTASATNAVIAQMTAGGAAAQAPGKKGHHSLPSSPVAQHVDHSGGGGGGGGVSAAAAITNAGSYFEQQPSAAVTTIAGATNSSSSSSSASCSSSSSSSSASEPTCCSTSTAVVDRNVKGLVHKYQATTTTTSSSSTAAASSSSSSSCCSASATTSTAAAAAPINTITTIASVATFSNFKPRPRSYYENPHATTTATHLKKQQQQPPPLSHSSVTQHDYNECRPPPAPAKITTSSTSSNTATPMTHESILSQQHQQQHTQQRRLQQHGKTHPLARLSLPKQSFNAAAYNTM